MSRILFVFTVLLTSTVFGQTFDLYMPHTLYIDKCDIQSVIPLIPRLINSNLSGALWKYGVGENNVTVTLNGSVIDGQSRLKEFETVGVDHVHNGVFKGITESEKGATRRFYGTDVVVDTTHGSFVLVHVRDNAKLASLYIMEPAVVSFPKSGGQPGEMEDLCVTGLMRAMFDPNDFSVEGPYPSVSIAMVSKDAGTQAPFAGINQLLSTAVAISAASVSLPTN